MKKKKNLGRRIYFIFLSIYTVALIVAALIGLSIVKNYAVEYEASLPVHAIEAYVAEIRENRWLNSMRPSVLEMRHEMQSDSECIATVKQKLSGEIKYSRVPTEEGIDGMSYALLSDGKKFGVVSFVNDESYADKSKFGMLPWKVSSEKFDFTDLYSSIEVTVPATFTVEINGNELGDEYIVEKDIKLDVLKAYYKSCPTLLTKVKYKVENLVGSVELKIYDDNGEEYTIDESRDDSQYIKNCSDSVFARLETFAYDFSDRYFHYITGLVDPTYGYQRLQTVMKSGSDLDERMKVAMDGLSWSHTNSLRIDSVTLNSGIDLGDGYYLADVTTKTTTLEPGRGEVNGTQNFKMVVQDSANELRALMLELY